MLPFRGSGKESWIGSRMIVMSPFDGSSSEICQLLWNTHPAVFVGALSGSRMSLHLTLISRSEHDRPLESLHGFSLTAFI